MSDLDTQRKIILDEIAFFKKSAVVPAQIVAVDKLIEFARAAERASIYERWAGVEVELAPACRRRGSLWGRLVAGFQVLT